MGKLFKNIKSLYGILSPETLRLSGNEMKNFESMDNAWLIEKDGLIEDYGTMASMPDENNHETVDLNYKMVLPSYCDSHTHLVFAAPRDQEFVDRINGLSYEEIASKGGGILNSAEKLRNMSEDELFEKSKERLSHVIKQGTGAIEIKSGYGLNLE